MGDLSSPRLVNDRGYQWTTKIDGKTITRRLNPHEAKLYQEWIDNDRKMRRLIAQMRQIAAQASQIHLAAAARH
jgi:hypothetical protein